MDKDSGRTAVIIGASSGIGEALAHQLNREGWNNRDLNVELDVDTVMVNVLGFMKTAQLAVRHFVRRGRGPADLIDSANRPFCGVDFG